MSWEGHLSGFLTGFLFAIIYRKIGIVKEEYQFNETDFDLLFDEHGNFSPPKVDEVEEVQQDLKNTSEL